VEDNVIDADVDGCGSSRDQSGAGSEGEERSEVHCGGVLYTDYDSTNVGILSQKE
jgi:hypothetical protein